ncbi:hypothetical protein COO60DRAFT_1483209 [Scenedesmus sp. NREL 46B-D3]|nr:hypothetical protein COO60DRAFT_1483209 [Scenedesmus sp. NREL 46B-D3]
MPTHNTMPYLCWCTILHVRLLACCGAIAGFIWQQGCRLAGVRTPACRILALCVRTPACIHGLPHLKRAASHKSLCKVAKLCVEMYLWSCWFGRVPAYLL